MLTNEELKTRFTYHAPTPLQVEKYEKLRDAAYTFACLICELTPESREQSLAITHLEDAIYSANAAIARRE
jgi:hypothetical protein